MQYREKERGKRETTKYQMRMVFFVD